MTSYVYVSTQVQAPVDLKLFSAGPDKYKVKLATTRLNSAASSAKVMEISRNTSAYAMFDVAFSVGGSYVASYGVLIRGHSNGSGIWWRWRTATGVSEWIDNRNLYETTLDVAGQKYIFSVQSDSTFLADDDLIVKIRSI